MERNGLLGWNFDGYWKKICCRGNRVQWNSTKVYTKSCGNGRWTDHSVADTVENRHEDIGISRLKFGMWTNRVVMFRPSRTPSKKLSGR